MDDVNFICAATVHATSGCWCLFRGRFVPDRSPAHSRLYFQSNNTDVEMLIDIVSLQPFTDDERRLQREEIIQMKLQDTEEAVSVGRLLIGDYNVPQVKKINRLGKISYQPEEFYSESGKPNVPKNLLWAKASSQWFELARKFEGIKLSSCVNSTVCLSRPARMVVGLRASTANIFIDNGPYREFLFKHFQVASVDEESAAVVLTCLSNKLNVIVFRGMSDLAGSQQGENPIAIFGPLAATNVVKATLEFIKRFPKSTLVT